MNSGSSSSQDDNFLRAFSYETRSRSRSGHINGRHSQDKKVSSTADGEIGVFTAEKYFSGEIDSQRSTVRINPTIYARSRELRISYNPTASAASESSWYSRSALLQNTALRKHDSSTHKRGEKKSKTFLSNLGCRCKCSCLDENSADIDEKVSETRPRAFPGLPHRSFSGSADEVFGFPTMSSLPRTLIGEGDEIPRESLEVFGSPVLQKRNRFSIKPKTRQESDSDQSSELFEMESMRGKAKAETFLARQGLGIESPPRAPSEASIEWSVVTASAADFSVASSDYSEAARPASSVSIGSPVYKNILMSKAKLETKQSSSVLLCCVDRSAGVAGGTYRIVSPRLDRDLLWRECYNSLERKERIRAESEMRGLELRNDNISASPRFFTSHSTSPHASRRMYIE